MIWLLERTAKEFKPVFRRSPTVTRQIGICNLRFDDTNPVKEDVEYVDSIMEDIKWLGFHWENVYYASDYLNKDSLSHD